MSGRGSKRPLQEEAAAASSSSSSSGGRSRNKSKGFDFKRDIVPMCAKLDGADLSQLRSILQSLAQEGKIAVDMNVVRRWNQARTCEALQKYFIGLEVAPELVNQVHALALGAFPDSMTAPAVMKDLPTLMESGFPDSMTKFLTNQEMIQLSATGQRSKRGTDKSHTQCLASTKQGTQCMRQLHSAEGECLHFCKTHITQAVAAFTQQTIDRKWSRFAFISIIIDKAGLVLEVGGIDEPIYLHVIGNAALQQHTAWLLSLVVEFRQVTQHLRGTHLTALQVYNNRPKIIVEFLSRFGKYVTYASVFGTEPEWIGPDHEGPQPIEDMDDALIPIEDMDDALIPFTELFEKLGLGPVTLVDKDVYIG